MNRSPRGFALTIFAILFALLAISNFLKPVPMGGPAGERKGFVFLGTRTSGTANLILGPTFGIIVAAYAFGIWRMKRYALPLSYAYLAYVVINSTLFTMKNPRYGSVGFVLLTSAIGIGVPLASAILLTRRRAELT
jgi:hypothetical protein